MATPPTAEARSLAHGLGLGADRLDLPVSVLSGGERRRVELARILFAGSDVLLLDEPTNHLDADAKAWLMKFLRGYRGALLVISHDLDLLDEAITRVLHLDRAAEEATGHLVEYKGTYSQYLAAARQGRGAAGQAGQPSSRPRSCGCRPAPTSSGPRHARPAWPRAWTSASPGCKGAMVDAPKGQQALRVHFPEPPHCGRVVLEVDGLAKSTAARRCSRTSASTSVGASACWCSG